MAATSIYMRRVGDVVRCGRAECGEQLGSVDGGLFKLRLGYDLPAPPRDFCEFLDRARGRKLEDGGHSISFPRRAIDPAVGDGRLWAPLPARVKCLRCGYVEVADAQRIGVAPTTHTWAPRTAERASPKRGRIVNLR